MLMRLLKKLFTGRQSLEVIELSTQGLPRTVETDSECFSIFTFERNGDRIEIMALAEDQNLDTNTLHGEYAVISDGTTDLYGGMITCAEIDGSTIKISIKRATTPDDLLS